MVACLIVKNKARQYIADVAENEKRVDGILPKSVCVRELPLVRHPSLDGSVDLETPLVHI